MDGKFTQGTWQASGIRFRIRHMDSDFPIETHLVGPDGDAICYVLYNPKFHSEVMANVRLIEAAPAMYAALKALMKAGDPVEGEEWVDQRDAKLMALDAIRRVEGVAGNDR
jgi:hypothetical protein